MKKFSLTFDDGPSDSTAAVLDLLGAHNARGSFFVVGKAAAEQPCVLRRILDEGHELGNHTWSHPRLARDCTEEEVRCELVDTSELVQREVGYDLRSFRAPYYDVDDRVLAVADGLGLRHVRAAVAPPDWGTTVRGTVIATLVLQQLRPGVIIGLHDGAPLDEGGAGADRSNLLEALSLLLPKLEERGYRSVPAAELDAAS